MAIELLTVTLVLLILQGLQLWIPREKFSSPPKDLKRDFLWFLINEVGMAFLIAKTVILTSGFFNKQLGPIIGSINLTEMNYWLQLGTFILILDLVSYWSHRIQHSTKLWDIHKLHHSLETLSPFSSYRHSFLETIYNNLIFISTTSLIKIDPQARNIGFLVFTNVCVFQHTNLKLPFIKYLSLVFITPDCHVTHHSKKNYLNKGQNFGFIFSIWDRFFRTYCAKDYEDFEIGIEENPFKGKLAQDFLYPIFKNKT